MQSKDSSVEHRYPVIAHWVRSGGWVEIGQDQYSRSFVRALYEGGMAWEGAEQYETLDDALHALERGIASFIEEFDTPRD